MLDTASDEYNLVLFGREEARRGEEAGEGGGPAARALRRLGKLKAATAQRKERDAARPTPPPLPEREWNVFGRNGEARAIQVAETGLSIDRESKTVKEFTMHAFPDAARTSAFAKQTVDGWLAEGFKPISSEEALALPKFSGDFVGPLPADAKYFVEKRGKLKIVRGFSRRHGVVGDGQGRQLVR